MAAIALAPPDRMIVDLLYYRCICRPSCYCPSHLTADLDNMLWLVVLLSSKLLAEWGVSDTPQIYPCFDPERFAISRWTHFVYCALIFSLSRVDKR
jgi:hypothetical protein